MTAIPYDDGMSHPTLLIFQWTQHDSDGQVTYTASGTCPVCRCAMTRVFTYGQPLLTKGGGFRGRRAKAGQQPFHTACQCRTLHTGRPAGESFGCGAMLVLAPPRPPANGSTP